METNYTFALFDSVSALPPDWDAVCDTNLFLSTDYLKVLERSAPKNMTCHFIGLFDDGKLIGGALSQFLDLNLLESFGERDRCVKTSVRNFMFKRFSSHVLFIGNNMLSGQNAFVLAKGVNKAEILKTLQTAAHELKSIFRKRGKKIHLVTFKDFDADEIPSFKKAGFDDYFQFSTQPNMVFEGEPHWSSFDDYISALSKKYRDQYKRARKKSGGIDKRKMSLDEIIANENTINDLYDHVARNAPFNTFFLPENHFRTLKECLHENFLFYGYFDDGKLIGFNTLIKNGDVLDTYFLGYDETVQREKMLYLNMLYDMIAYSINKGFKKIIFARTALEIKSSVGAKPVEMYGFMKHSNSFINTKLERVFGYLEPKTEWQQRHPFKENADLVVG
ncbi:MAG: GNAT family N-acetyltransferase [Flavobacterium sp.]|uniref:GNAT family N-acetyltransferase n=1 Tax=Flavobacterium sp. TaxID=239 RepID=UPI001225A3AD|nr:GNAT family N-acetyltransferase [Flavobacterium sp.]RZJ66401.1 MAG: GNAT family N-acetyltransferase [Flavobacterium sp.]